MKYIFDNNTLTGIFRHYYREAFPSFWDLFNKMVIDENILSVREVYNEIKNYSRKDELEDRAKTNQDFFNNPTTEELNFITQIFGSSGNIVERVKKW